jgi:hypothetical protein
MSCDAKIMHQKEISSISIPLPSLALISLKNNNHDKVIKNLFQPNIIDTTIKDHVNSNMTLSEKKGNFKYNIPN